MAVSEAVDGFVLSVGRETWELFKRDALMFVLGWVVVMALAILSLGLVAGPLFIVSPAWKPRPSGRGGNAVLGLASQVWRR
jgi:ABC-type transport system involved in cytochrome c biogenesis permease subunit